ncbi:hypothetical protein [Hyphomicrobium sulfonivorans]|uniref:hypothetical protein n=1 Tax=Hyphomicrobium sulfonivorans TaxID=121290 RepID=UPI0015707AE9|nr:hypothetical protein [Hyphomicrobium sulfonivorans]MBI1651334.1 hypothetical protein [Hyphomicrobium sulfonivorans]NSL72785.1 hypothetical protein [Hyphomicrobium sulfonivorans]
MEDSNVEASATPAAPHTWQSFLVRKLPYIALLALTIGGVAFTSIANTPLVRYWEILAVLTGLLCIFTAWPHYDGQGRLQLILRQSAHWLAIIVAMRIVLMPGIQTMFTGPATGYALLLILALGTFLAGLNISLELCVLGLVMAAAVPAMLWLKQTALLAVLLGAAGVALFAVLWRRK